MSRLRFLRVAGIFILFWLVACRDRPVTPPATSLPQMAASTLPPPQINSTVTQPHPDQPTPQSPNVVPTLTLPPPPPPLTERLLAHSPAGIPLVAHRVGWGEINVAIIGYEHPLAEQLLATFRANPEMVPANISLWILPDLNPDGEGRGVDLRRNADTDLDGCAGNEWQPNPDEREGAGGTYPFSEAESIGLEGLLQDSWLAIFLESTDNAGLTEPRIVPGGCRIAGNPFPANLRLAEQFSANAGIPIARAEPDSGNWSDYLVGEGVANLRVALPATPQNSELFATAVQTVLRQITPILGVDEVVPFDWLNKENVGVWHFPPSTFIHPIALTVVDNTAYLLDSGRVLALDLSQPDMPNVLLRSLDIIANEWVSVPVQEPFDLEATPEGLLVLDRVGDVYLYNAGSWQVERYDRPISEASSHYYTALTAGNFGRFLLENSYSYINQYAVPYSDDQGWRLDEHFQVDVAGSGDFVYLLYREQNSMNGGMLRYQNSAETTIREPLFRSSAPLFRPRQLVARRNALYTLDYAGRRVLTLDPERGTVQQIRQFADRTVVSAIWADETGERILMVGKDALYFVGEPTQQATIAGTGEMPAITLNDADTLQSLRGLLVPISGSPLTQRDLQMPGAPRHYRLGIHEGVDFYWTTGTQVRAVADGVVIRANHDYLPPSSEQIRQWRDESWALGITSPSALDGFRGQQLWVQHENGTISRYVHLSGIEPNVVEGTQVQRGQIIAQVGNSGSPGSLISGTEDAHLHFELWLNEHYLGQFLRPIEVREWLERLMVPH